MESLLLVFAVVIDGFTACFAYGINKIKIPLFSAFLISLLGTCMLILSMLAATWIGGYLPSSVCKAVSFTVLLVIGLCNIFQNSIKALLKKAHNNRKKVNFTWSGISFMLSICLDETKADADGSKVLSASEAVALGAALSIDSLATGIASGLMKQNLLLILGISLILHFIAILSGYVLGKKMATQTDKHHLSLEWLGGMILIVLAFFRLWR